MYNLRQLFSIIYLKYSEQKNYLFIDKNHYVSPALTLGVGTILTWGKLYQINNLHYTIDS